MFIVVSKPFGFGFGSVTVTGELEGVPWWTFNFLSQLAKSRNTMCVQCTPIPLEKTKNSFMTTLYVQNRVLS